MEKTIELGPYSWESSIDCAEDVEDAIGELVDEVGEWPGVIRITVSHEEN